MLSVKKILCPTDFSEPSYKALKTANDIAEKFSAELILIHVYSPAQIYPAAPAFPPSAVPDGGVMSGDLAVEIKKDAEKSLEMTIKEKVPAEIKSKSIFLQGNPAEVISRYAEESDIDVIVMGTHGFTGWRHLMIGSVTEKVVRQSSCPVLTIPADKDE